MTLLSFPLKPLSHSAVSATDPLAHFQSLECPIPVTRPCKFHIKSRKDLSENVILGRWLFNQYFGDIMAEDNSGEQDLPQIAIRANSDELLKEESVKRTRKSVLVECHTNDIAKEVEKWQ